MPTTQLLLRLEVREDCAWEQRYHRKVRGRFDQALQGTPYEQLHDSQKAAFTFSKPMHYAPELDAGDELHLVVASPSEGVLRAIADDLRDKPFIGAGSMSFDVRAAQPIEQDVGVPGASGTVTTGSAILMIIDSGHDRGTDHTYWSDRDYEIAAFQDAFQTSVQRLFEHETDGNPPDEPLFDRFHHRKTFAAPLDVTASFTQTIVASHWDLDYTVRDETHRRRLNTLIAHGIGHRRAYGLGMLQPRNGRQSTTAAEGAASHA